MAMTSSEKQAAYRDRMNAKGWTQTTIWYCEKHPKEAVKALLDQMVLRARMLAVGDPETMTAETALAIVQAQLLSIFEDMQREPNE